MNGIPLLHVPVESYSCRYTADLYRWEEAAFTTAGFAVEAVAPAFKPNTTLSIVTGEVLDSLARPQWALAQVSALLKKAPSLGKIYFSDFFHPGLEALPYSRTRFQAYSYCWAQTFDQFDFTRLLFNDWMRPWEIMAFEVYSRVFVASDLLQELIVSALPHVADKVKVVGLPYNSAMVFRQLTSPIPAEKTFDVVYTSRWDVEKSPHLFLDLVEVCPDLNFLVCTGHDKLKGTATDAIERALALQAAGRLTIKAGLSRSDYFANLHGVKVQFNCGNQDWVSFTLLDALTMGCYPLYPAHRSFPETLHYDERVLYRPSDLVSAESKLRGLLTLGPHHAQLNQLAHEVLTYHNGSLSRIADEMKG